MLLAPFNIEGKIVIATDAPSNAERVTDGVEKWLRTQEAQEMRQVAGRIEFNGNPVYTTAIRRRMKNPRASIWKTPGLRGIGKSTIEFEKHADKVIIRFRVSSAFLGTNAVVPLLIVAVVLARLSFLLPIPLFIVGAAVHIWLTPRILRRHFERELHVAIGGLADGAAAELAALRSRSQLAGTPTPA